MFHSNVDWQLFDQGGRRKYLTADERGRFLAAANGLEADRRALCYLLAFTGCRISEALNLRQDHFDSSSEAVIFKTLKRRHPAFRAVPVPPKLADQLAKLPALPDGRFWHIHRVTAYRLIRDLMLQCGIHGPMATCKGLRHAFGIRAATCNVPPNLIQRWMGHASPNTTAIYLDAVGVEEREFAGRMW